MSVVVSDTTPLNYLIPIGMLMYFRVLVLGTLAVLNIADANGWLEFEAAVSRLRATNFRFSESVLGKVRAVVRARKQS